MSALASCRFGWQNKLQEVALCACAISEYSYVVCACNAIHDMYANGHRLMPVWLVEDTCTHDSLNDAVLWPSRSLVAVFIVLHLIVVQVLIPALAHQLRLDFVCE